MKYWMPGVIALMAMPAVHAANYRLVYSPSQQLEVFIDDVKNNKPTSWCARSIPLRIVSNENKDMAVLDEFLPRVGNLIEKQCAKAAHLPWTLTDSNGTLLASGESSKNQSWLPEIKATENMLGEMATPMPTATAVSPLADKAPVQVFNLLKGCKFRTYWNDSAAGSSLFIPSGDTLRCASDGWLSGSNTLTLQQGGKTMTPTISFYQGYPLMNVDVAMQRLTVVSANSQRLVLGSPQAAGSYLLLPFDTRQHVWIFKGTLIAELPHQDATDAKRVKQRLAEVHKAWQPLLKGSNRPLTVYLLDKLAVDRVDPTNGSYQSVQDTAH